MPTNTSRVAPNFRKSDVAEDHAAYLSASSSKHGIIEARAKAYAERHGGTAIKMEEK